MKEYIMSSQSSFSRKVNSVKGLVFIDGERQVFNSITLWQTLNDCQRFELVQNETSNEVLWQNSPQKRNENIGRSVLIQFVYGEEIFKYEFYGYITEILMDACTKNAFRFIGQGKIVALKDAPSMDSFINVHLVNIVNTIAQEKEFDIQCEPKFQEVIPFAMRYKESSFDFLNRLSAIYNELFFYDGRNLVFGTPQGETVERLNFKEHISHLKTISKALPYRHSLYGYQAQDNQHFFSELDRDISPENETTKSLLDRAYLFGERGILPVSETAQSNSEVQDLRQGKYQSALGKMHYVEGVSDDCRVRIGGLIRIGYPDTFKIDKNLGVYRVISVTHKVDKEDYSNTFVAVPQGMEYAMFEPTTVAYPEIAEVIANDDPLGQGRVKVRFLWQRMKNLQTNWLRVQSLDAGQHANADPNRGFVFVPEVGDQVMINFEHGNPHRPYVSGSMFHKGNTNGISNNIRSITTKSGSTIIFDDTRNAEKIIIKDNEGSAITFDAKQKSLFVQSIETLEFSAKNIKLKAEENVEITTQKDVLINSKSKTVLNSESDMELLSKTNVRLQSEEEMTLKSNDTLRVEAQNKATLRADTTIVEGKTQAEFNGAQTKVTGKSLAEITANIVKIN